MEQPQLPIPRSVEKSDAGLPSIVRQSETLAVDMWVSSQITRSAGIACHGGAEPTINALNEFIDKEYEQHKQKNKREVYGELVTFCKTQTGLISAPSYKTFVAAIKHRPRDVQVKKRAGRRAAYSHEPLYLELSYTLPRHGDRPFEVVHLDHTELDVALVSTPAYFWLILVFGEALKTTDLSAMLLQKDVAGGGKECRLRPCFPYQKDWK